MSAASPTTIGVYRWDAYHGGDGDIYATVKRCLAGYHDKLPFYGRVNADGSVEADATGHMDAEIEYACRGGVDYWIFLRYIDTDAGHRPMNLAYAEYRRSPRKGDIKFCWMLGHSLNNDSAWEVEKLKTLEAMRDPQWIRVLGDRPLLYVYQDCARPSLPAKLAELRAAANPYIVAISFDPAQYGCDARTEWPRSGGQGDPAPAFTEVVAQQNRQLLSGKAVLAAHVNWDSRPYHDNPPSWWCDPPNAWYQMPTGAEYRSRLQAAVDSTRANPERCEANTIFVYAWNEFTEGGILCPTKRSDGTINSSILDGLSWRHPLTHRVTVSKEMGETTPFVFRDRLYRVENWQKYLDVPGSAPGEYFMGDQVRIWDVANQKVVSVPFTGHSFGIAYCHNGRVYVFATRHEADRPWRHFRSVSLSSSDDLVNWTAPVTVIEAEGDEHLYNTAVCHDGRRFVLLYESDGITWQPGFTFKYCESSDLIHWRRVPDAIYGKNIYVGGPALYFEGDWFYTLFLHDLGSSWETRVTRSKDLVHWEDAPLDRPFLAPDRTRVMTYNHFGKTVTVPEINASDAEICYWQGKTLVYFNGGDQQTCGDLQQAEFAGTPRELLEKFFEEPPVTVPSPRQLTIQEKQFGAFIHFGMATWYDGPSRAVFPESLRHPYAFNMDAWGLMVAQPPATTFNPNQLNPEQWVTTAKAMGAKHVVLTAKHHNGFCLWPTRTTAYRAHTDVVREFVNAARQHGLGVGLYLSAGDVNAGCFSTPEPQGQRRLIGDLSRYFLIVRKQLRELLSDYGPLDELWFDAALDPLSVDVLQPDGTPVGRRYWDDLVALVRQLQPAAVIMGGSQPDLRWPGNEEGFAPYPLSCVVEPGQERENWVPPGAAGWIVPEADVFTRPTWFWTPESDGALFGTERLLDIYHRSIGHGANLLVNMTPDRRGLIPDAEVARLTEFGRELRQRFSTPLAMTGSEGRWGEGMTLDLMLDRTAAVQWLSLEEDLRFGQRITGYQIEARTGEQWLVVATGESIGRKRIQRLTGVRTDCLRLRVLRSEPLPKIRAFACYP